MTGSSKFDDALARLPLYRGDRGSRPHLPAVPRPVVHPSVMDGFTRCAAKLGLMTSACMSPFVVLGLAMGHLEPLIGLLAFWVIGSLGIAGLYALERSA